MSARTSVFFAGYRPTFVNNLDELEAALARGRWGTSSWSTWPTALLVRSRLNRRAASAVLPCPRRRSGYRMIKQARAEYKRIIKAAGRGQAFVDGIDDVLASKQAEAASSKQK